jgi:hypothetical protein
MAQAIPRPLNHSRHFTNTLKSGESFDRTKVEKRLSSLILTICVPEWADEQGTWNFKSRKNYFQGSKVLKNAQ